MAGLLPVLSSPSNFIDPIEKLNGYPSARLQIFKHHLPSNGEGEIVVSGYVLADGKGDYFHMRNIAKTIHRNFPKHQITLLVGSDVRHCNLLPLLDETLCKTYFAFKGKGGPLLLIPQPPIEPEDFQGVDVLQKVKEAAVIISGPTPLLRTFDSVQKEISSKVIGFDEYNGDMEKDTSTRFVLKAGIGGNRLGIFTKKKKIGLPCHLQNKRIKDLLFRSQNTEQISSPLYVCYTSSTFAILKFVDHIVAYSDPDTPMIDICCPAKGDLSLLAKCLEDFSESEYKDRWTAKGMGQLRIIYFEGDEKNEMILKWANAKGIISIFDVGFLSPKDFKTLVRLSGPFMGCTGDTSLAIALSNNKIPVYEVGGHKRDLLQNLSETAEDLFGKDCVLAAYFRTLMTDPRFIWLERARLEMSLKFIEDIQSKPIDPLIKEILLGGLLNEGTVLEISENLKQLKKDAALSLIQEHRESLIRQAFEFGEFTRAFKSIQPILIACVAEGLLRHKFPQFAQKGDILIEKYLNSGISKEQFIQTLEDEFASTKDSL